VAINRRGTGYGPVAFEAIDAARPGGVTGYRAVAMDVSDRMMRAA
jgi:hypothetical protein